MYQFSFFCGHKQDIYKPIDIHIRTVDSLAVYKRMHTDTHTDHNTYILYIR